MAFSFLIPPESTGLSASERRTLRMIAELLDAMSQPNAATNVDDSHPRFVFGNVELDTVSRSVTIDGQPVRLTPREYDLLFALATANGKVVSHEELRSTVWHGTIDRDSRAISQCVSELRRKIEEDPSHPQHIILVRKYGYRLSGTWL